MNPHATKTQIRHAVEEIFNVNVIKVNTVNVRGKSNNFARRGNRTTGKQSDWKKAIVTFGPARRSNWAASTTSSNKMPVKKYRRPAPGVAS